MNREMMRAKKENEEMLIRIGENLLKAMAIQATVRTNKVVSTKHINESSIAMTIATRLARRLILRARGTEEAARLLTGVSNEVLQLIEYIPDGALALGMNTHQEELV